MNKLDRPYEKLENYGENYLSNSELLSIILGVGTKGKNSIEVAEELLKNSNRKNKGCFFEKYGRIS